MTDQWESRPIPAAAIIPAGWEPYAATAGAGIERVWIRRRVPDEAARLRRDRADFGRVVGWIGEEPI